MKLFSSSKASTPAFDRTPKHKDPRNVLKDQLKRTEEMAKEAFQTISEHQHALKGQRDELRSRLDLLSETRKILDQSIGDEDAKSLTKGAPPKSPPAASTNPSTPAATTRTATSPGGLPTHVSGGLPTRGSSIAPSSAAGGASKWGKARAAVHLAMPSPSKHSSMSFSARAAVENQRAASMPWSSHEDEMLLKVIKEVGLHLWSTVSEELQKRRPSDQPRTHFACRERWEQLVLHASTYLTPSLTSSLASSSIQALAAFTAFAPTFSPIPRASSPSRSPSS